MISSLVVIFYLVIPPFNGDYCSPYDKDFVGYRYRDRVPVCRRNVYHERKVSICERDGVTDRSDFTVDHIVPLALGGNNSDTNLWCQHKSISTARVEGHAYRMVDKGIWTIEEARDYVEEYKFHKN